MREYKIGFSLKGLLAFLIVMFPNIVWMIIPPNNDFLSTNSSSIEAINVIMSISQWVMIALLILLIRSSGESEHNRIYKMVCILCMGIYYFSWVCYYIGITSPIMFIGMAVFPCCFFISFILWQKTYLILIPAITFAVIHISVTICNVM